MVFFMSTFDPFIKQSYERHSEHLKCYQQGSAKEAHAQRWLLPNTVDSWRHKRMYDLVLPILKNDPNTTWLTVGDGRFGLDAQYIMSNGSACMATDISDTLLIEAKQKNLINDYQIENAEALSFDDNQFDYTFCKESFHHFPRPIIALYEMLRVSKKAAVLIEPSDPLTTPTPLKVLFQNFKKMIKFILKKDNSEHHYEEVGNYIYKLSIKEITKIAIAQNFSTIATKGINDVYLSGVENEMVEDHGPLLKKTKRRIFLYDLLCLLRLQDHLLVSVVIFKSQPSKATIEALIKHRYTIVHLPQNPHMNFN
ncbi:MAG: hypothetical protein A2417_19775 [Bdellovibrionales bacterium RIFOXYC1_FULL_37_79]|nr:MAG: hypothetical protein A2417_19775 [Bdellovibrionales bacterium RIFOXYC1_FULL_37_79]